MTDNSHRLNAQECRTRVAGVEVQGIMDFIESVIRMAIKDGKYNATPRFSVSGDLERRLLTTTTVTNNLKARGFKTKILEQRDFEDYHAIKLLISW